MVLNNKRGAFAWAFFGSLLVVLVVVVLAILFFSGVFSDLGRKAGTVSGAESFATEICAGLAQQGGSGAIQSYCYQFKEVEKDDWINCKNPDVENILMAGGIEGLECSDPDRITREMKEVCEEAGSNRKDDVTVNGVTCEDKFPELYGGSSDTGSSDTGSSDTGSSDTGSSDTGSSDTGSSDTGGDTGGQDNVTQNTSVQCSIDADCVAVFGEAGVGYEYECYNGFCQSVPSL